MRQPGPLPRENQSFLKFMKGSINPAHVKLRSLTRQPKVCGDARKRAGEGRRVGRLGSCLMPAGVQRPVEQPLRSAPLPQSAHPASASPARQPACAAARRQCTAARPTWLPKVKPTFCWTSLSRAPALASAASDRSAAYEGKSGAQPRGCTGADSCAQVGSSGEARQAVGTGMAIPAGAAAAPTAAETL